MSRIELRAWREYRGLTQVELAKRSRVGQQAISAIERGGTTKPHENTCRALARALRCKPSDLYANPEE
jgi:DNA-binding XRE family transcriptional regulator